VKYLWKCLKCEDKIDKVDKLYLYERDRPDDDALRDFIYKSACFNKNG